MEENATCRLLRFTLSKAGSGESIVNGDRLRDEPLLSHMIFQILLFGDYLGRRRFCVLAFKIVLISFVVNILKNDFDLKSPEKHNSLNTAKK